MTTVSNSSSSSDVGSISGTYQKVFSAVYQHILSDSQISNRGHRVLCGPTASIPILPMLEKRTSWTSLMLFDGRREHVEFQRSKIEDRSRVEVVRADLPSLAALARENNSRFDLVFDPLGLQETLSNWSANIKAIEDLLWRDSLFLTASWGVTRYPDEVAEFPGIIQDRRFSKEHLTPRVVSDSFVLVHEHEVKFTVEHNKQQMLKLISLSDLQNKNIDRLLSQETYAIQSCIYIRKYRKI